MENKREAYLDHAATTWALPSVIDHMSLMMQKEYGNPSSKHEKGWEAEKEIRTARETIAQSLKCDPKEIVFTSGGTEANNQAIIGTALAYRRSGKHIISTVMEHASVHEPLIFLEEQGYEVTYLTVDSWGHVNPEKLRKAIREDTILVSIMYVNNEVGAVQDIKALAQVIHETNPNTVFHVDAIQAYGKYRICPKKEGIDLLSVSGHKIHGPKGTGFLYRRDRLKTRPILYGGGQEKGMRSGTENVPGIVGMGEAVSAIYTNHDEKVQSLYEKKAAFIEQLTQMNGIHINAYDQEQPRRSAPHIISVSFDSVKSEVLLHALEEQGVYVSSGSACSSNHPALSGTLKAIGVSKQLLDSTLRFSLSFYTTQEELDYAAKVVASLAPVFAKYYSH